MATTQISDAVVPEVFNPYAQLLTEQKARLVTTGVLALSERLSELLLGGGMTFNFPTWNDLSNDEERVGSDDPANAIPNSGGTAPNIHRNIGSNREIAARLSRNQSWSTMDLTEALAGSDPSDAIAQRVGFYWARRLQAAVIAIMNGVIADNIANDSADYQFDISGSTFVDGVTNFSAEAFLDATVTLGDSLEDLSAVMLHSIVYNRMRKNNLIDFIPDSEGRVNIPTFQGHTVIVDDGMPNTSGVFDTWLFGAGALFWGVGSPKVPTEVDRQPQSANGSGQENLYSRVEWSIHPAGHAIQNVTSGGGPTNTVLAQATSWDRVWPERKQIKFARLVTRES